MLLCVYRKQEITCQVFCKDLEKLLDEVSDTAEVLLVVGDFNVWMEQEADRDAKKLRTLMSAYGLSQMINEPTHKGGHTLDHLYHNEHLLTIDYEVHQDTYGITTDHYPYTIKIPCEVKEEKPIWKTMRPFKKINMELFRKDIETMVINIVDSNDNFESTYKQFKDEAKSVLDDHCPEQIRKVKKNNKPKWIDTEFEKARAERRKRERKWRKSQVEEDYQQYKEQRNLCAKQTHLKTRTTLHTSHRQSRKQTEIIVSGSRQTT